MDERRLFFVLSLSSVLLYIVIYFHLQRMHGREKYYYNQVDVIKNVNALFFYALQPRNLHSALRPRGNTGYVTAQTDCTNTSKMVPFFILSVILTD